MIKFKHFLLVGLIMAFCYSCSKDSNSVTNFDHAAQALKDNDSIVKFLKTHYFDKSLDVIKPLINGKISLFDDTEKLKRKKVTEREVNYTLYYYVEREGKPIINKGYPTVADSVLTKYNGVRLVNTDSLTTSFDKGVNWFVLTSVVRGWTYGLTNFKGGENTTSNGPITYKNSGKGILFIPSGLGYRNNSNSKIPANSNLIFYVELWDHIKNTDHDNDNVPSIKEDRNNDGNLKNDDTDKDGIADFLDIDDDGDGKLTKNEDANGDGDPTNDFSDKNNPTIPDYLNRKIF